MLSNGGRRGRMLVAALRSSLPLTAGYILAIPFAMLTAAPALGAFFVRTGLCGIPEDFEPPAEVVAIQGGAAR